jgi:hypothetical protein
MFCHSVLPSHRAAVGERRQVRFDRQIENNRNTSKCTSEKDPSTRKIKGVKRNKAKITAKKNGKPIQEMNILNEDVTEPNPFQEG